MATPPPFLPIAIVSILLSAGGLVAQPAAAQGSPCSVEPGRDHAGETPLFTGIDQSSRPFTLTRNQETGAWSLWVVMEFTKEEGGLEVGKPCLVLTGDESKMLAAAGEAPDAVAATGSPDTPVVASTEPVAETYRVTGLAAGKVLDLRSGPGTDYPSVLQMPPESTGVVVGSCKEVGGYQYPWCEATFEGTQGWASACCLEGERTGRRLE
jgi:hypothetical protein